ncbi:MAG: hypothetical protein HYY44_09270 [Deltaproteobacteria bacterium]|nr:hypothetical protein [Deltaproteobacteria bacterium]
MVALFNISKKRLFLLLVSLSFLGACAGGGKDEPFIFPSVIPSEGTPPPTGPRGPEAEIPCEENSDCPEGQVCSDGKCAAETEVVCEKDEECEAGKICKIGEDEKGSCVEGCRTDGQCRAGERCTENNSCQPVVGEDLCETEFEATLALYIDATNMANPPGDAPSACSNYPSPPHTDLYCCHTTSETPPPLNGEERFCARDETLALTRFRGSQPMKMKFDFSNGCKVYVATADFPAFRLDNTALEAALVIDTGGTYDRLRDHVAVSDCHETEEGGIAIDNLPFQFMIRLYDNFNRCQILGGGDCVGPSFSRWFSDFGPTSNPPPNQSFQILPGLSRDFLHLTTSAIEVTPLPGTADVAPIRISGTPATFDPGTGKTRLSLVTGLIVPEGTASNPDQGTGQLGAALGNAVMVAEISGILRNPAKEDGTIESLSDLRENCGGGGSNGVSVVNLTASVATPLRQGELLSENLPVTKDDNGRISVDLCLPGTHDPNGCVPAMATDLPFAKEDGDPLVPGIEGRFIQQATVTLTIGAGSNQNLDLNVPDQVGPFKIINANELNTAIFAPIVSSAIGLQMEFHPELASQGCSSSNGQVTCSSEVRIGENPEITLSLHGFARPPAPSIEIAELNLAQTNLEGTRLAIDSTTPPIVSFSEQIIGIQTENKLLRISNKGVRSLDVTSIEAQDINLNFRVGAVYQGENFDEREWRGNREQWSIPPDGRGDLFFFLNYGPFARPVITSLDRRRTDHTLLKVEATGLSPATATLTGIAKQDRRGTLAVYLQDESRFTASGTVCDPLCPEGVDQVVSETETAHLFRGNNLLISFRQDGTERALYLKNDGLSGTEEIVIESRPQFSGTDVGKFCIKWTDLEETECHTEGSAEGKDAPADTFRITLIPGEKRKIATVQFDVPETTPEYQIFQAQLQLSAYSGRPGNRPKIGGVSNDTGSGTQVVFNLKGSNGAPGGTRNLIVHRLIAGIDKDGRRLSDSLQKSRVLSTATRGILDRAGISDLSYLNRFTLPGGISLDPIAGTAILSPIYTPVDPPGSLTPRESLEGIRIYNSIGNTINPPVLSEYSFQCEEAPSHTCSYFYFYLSDWRIADRSPSCAGTKVAVSDTDLRNLLDPVTEGDCIEEYYEAPESPARSVGTFDPVTGEISFADLAVRLFTPLVPVPRAPLDAILRLSLTTECVSANFVPDPGAQAKRLVPQSVIDDPGAGCAPCFNREWMGLGGENPVSFFIHGPQCSDPDELHGRRLLEVDTTGTMDRGAEGELPAGALTFDLAGVAQLASTDPRGNEAMMYIVIKAEIER